ncbi:MAG: hypothetical protein PVF54_01715 [Anaerolineae bacterium]|jgi:hypothetical protein
MKPRIRVMIIGGIAGALLGIAAAQLYWRSASAEVDEEGEEKLPAVEPGDAIKLSLGVLGVLRQIAGMGRPSR